MPDPIPPQLLGDQLLIGWSLVGQLHGQVTINTFHYRVAPEQPVNFQAFVAAWEGAIRTQLLPPIRAALSNEWTARSTTTRATQNPALLPLEVLIQPPLAGLAAGESVPATVAALVRKRTAFGGRRGRGRVYLPGVREADSASSELIPAAMVGFTTIGTAMTTVLVVGVHTLTPFVYSPPAPTDPVLVPIPVRGSPITNCVAQPILANQRRRRPGRGI